MKAECCRSRSGDATLVLRPPDVPFAHQLLAENSFIASTSPVVRLSSNENPHGPSSMALKAMTDAFSLAWRYPDEHADVLIDTIAKLNGVSRDQIVLGDGSGE